MTLLLFFFRTQKIPYSRELSHLFFSIFSVKLTSLKFQYTLPGIVHMQNQQRLENVRGPAVLVLAPTRELVQQISSMAMNFHSKVACAYGGSGRDQQARTIRAGQLGLLKI